MCSNSVDSFGKTVSKIFLINDKYSIPMHITNCKKIRDF